MFEQGIKKRISTGGKYGAALGALTGASLVVGGLRGSEKKRQELLQKKASAATEAETIGKYLLHNVAVPGATIFAADLGAHAAADNLLKKEELKKLASALRDRV